MISVISVEVVILSVLQLLRLIVFAIVTVKVKELLSTAILSLVL
jgi:hypothetical protein